jgi:hypothetical protein
LPVAGIDGDDEITHPAIAAGRPENDLVLDRERRRRKLQFRLAVGKIGLPDNPAIFLVRGDHARRIIRNRDDQAAPQRSAAIRGNNLFLPRVHAPHDAARFPGPRVDLVKHAPLVGDVEEAVLGKRRCFQILVRRGAADRDRVRSLRFFTLPVLILSSGE